MEERWEKVRQIVREECERIEKRILAVIEKNGGKPKLGFVGGRWTGITDEQSAAWHSAYGSCDIESELKKAAAWIVSNPHLAPKSQFGRFLNTWLSRQQNVSSIRAIPMRSEVKKERWCAWCRLPSSGSTNGNEHCAVHAVKALHEDPPARVA